MQFSLKNVISENENKPSSVEEFVGCVSSTRRWGCVHKCSKIYIRRRQTQITTSFMKGISSLHWLIKELCSNLMQNVYLTITKNFDPSRHFPRQKIGCVRNRSAAYQSWIDRDPSENILSSSTTPIKLWQAMILPFSGSGY